MFVVAHGITPDLMLSLQTPLYQRSMCHFYFKLLLHLDCKSTILHFCAKAYKKESNLSTIPTENFCLHKISAQSTGDA
jgi:hypothetical protein